MCTIQHMVLILYLTLLSVMNIGYISGAAFNPFTAPGIKVGIGYSSDSQQIVVPRCYRMEILSSSHQNIISELDNGISSAELENDTFNFLGK